MFDIIAVPVDGSDYGYKAADVAIEIAQKFNSKIAAVHVLEEFSFSSYDSEEDEGNSILSKITKKANDVGVEVTEHLLTADPLRDMKFIVDQTRADLVVIHAHGSNNNRFVSFEENNVSDTQIGSVSERLLRTSEVPVLLIR
ncbi:Nucleotide-binding universal stress protein, UspA family [Methanobrevibacter gottschalkii]|uniref:Nucleotide-binding universal stress UspA family protein n=2 Tax=Methanobrevibacter gottschalkii TaxID=190974 RepID=A0A3N5B373_9EURY|nr:MULTISPECIES: universal stress protein [Methanobrevibacter]MCQ2971473.1 universal stress protein [archaeon]OEC94532.1 universal stress protein UspA [Methanobrevibacter sp. A27]RPF51834.1 nucleotide-binding universal stress UspA family protein [Methanobrevibacter gottschalkii DSM 11977]SEK94398.1 Nucleotide-binding universal stress protein, UspA family [Methanobrevibacter gottschalkii]